MAEIFRPACFVDLAPGNRVNATFPGAARKKSPTWWIRYYTPDGKRHNVKGYTDKKATETKAAELERRGIREDAGLVDPSDVHEKTPLAEHAEDFISLMASKGNVPVYVSASRYRLTAILDARRIRRDLKDARAVWHAGFQDARQQTEAEQSDLGLSRRRRPLRRLPRIAAFVHYDGRQGRGIGTRTSGLGPALDVCPDKPLLAFAFLRSFRRRAGTVDPDDRPRHRIAIDGRYGNGWTG